MTGPARLRSAVAPAVGYAAVFAGCVAAGRWLAPAWPIRRAMTNPVYWPLLAGVVAGMICGWRSLGIGRPAAGPTAGGGRAGRAVGIICGFLAHALLGALTGFEWGRASAGTSVGDAWLVLPAAVAVGPLVWLLSGWARPWPAAAALVLMSVAFTLWIAWDLDEFEAAGLGRFSTVPDSEPPSAGPDGELLGLWDCGPAAAHGPFASAVGEAVAGWQWVRSGLAWRESLLVQVPGRVTARLAALPEGPVRLFLALPAQETAAAGPAVDVTVTLHDGTGADAAVGRLTIDRASITAKQPAWQEVVLAPAADAGPATEIVLEAAVAGSADAADRPPLLAVSVPRPRPESAGPSCLFILVDALRADRLHCYGFEAETSPRLDRLAAEGTLFERVESGCPWTVPSVATLFTGAPVASHGMSGFQVPGRLGLSTMAEAFRQAGARTAAVSANTLVYPGAGFGAGFDVFLGSHEFERTPRGDWVTDHAIRLLREFGDKRFFLYAHYMDVHGPYDPPPKWATFGWTFEERYLGEIGYCDHEIGRLLDALAALGRTDDTLVVFIADHGEAFGEHGFSEHGNTVHPEEIHVPLILRFPGTVPAGRRVPALVPSAAAHTTIRELVGLEIPRHVEAESLTPFLEADGAGADRPAFSELYWRLGVREGVCPQVGLHDGRYKCILHLPPSDRTLLYDVRRDPGERTDLSAAQPEVSKAMAETIRRFIRERKGSVLKTDQPLSEAAERRLRALGYLAPGD